MDYLTTARSILDKVIYATIATADKNGHPFAAPLFIFYDEATKSMYWCADRHSQHGQNIVHSGKAYIVVYDSSVKPGQGEGLYLQTDAAIVTDVHEATTALQKLISRHQGVPYWSADDILAPDARVAIFKARITQAWVNEGSEQDGKFVFYRKPIDL